MRGNFDWDDIPVYLDRRPLPPGHQLAYDAIQPTWHSNVMPFWSRASAVVHELVIAKRLRANTSSYLPGHATAELAILRTILGSSKALGPSLRTNIFGKERSSDHSVGSLQMPLTSGVTDSLALT
jgi:hypothetical protein